MKNVNAYGVTVNKLKIAARHWTSTTTGVVAFVIDLFINEEDVPAVVMRGNRPFKPSALDILSQAIKSGKLPKPEGNVSGLGYIKKIGIPVEISDQSVKSRKDL